MKNIRFTMISICFLALSCNTYKRDRFTYRGVATKKDAFWIEIFKDEMFYECIKEGNKNDTILTLMKKKDLLNISDGGMTFDEVEIAKKIGKEVIENMPPPFIHLDEDVKNLNFISASCLHYYASRELDSIAREAYKRHLKKGN
jgi:hypothetical protein